jgi:hypothetical protein
MPNTMTVDPIRAAIRAKQSAALRRFGVTAELESEEDITPPTVSAGAGSGNRPLRQPADVDTLLRQYLGR